ncbi:hypothetical protein CYLTODRAFT_424537 [Cylindrobasidium torrendii FP15055 ss-10]|uniref:Uncharacterized protein n=1 Tax=Cylindrobasidium torrendii FP15055 ss-10 TaxID=1314674 RepID=A0A0D7B4V7_9AGAR|nr:hypothetical protein CYLTODRAFT_424537 [Cylindrobasidium torrendii FP15055 ss-10]
MGFFSVRRPDEASAHNDKSVVNVIRSRFYGKHTRSHDENEAHSTFTDAGASAAQTLSHPPPTPLKKAPSNRAPHTPSKAGPSTPNTTPQPQRVASIRESTKENIGSPRPRKPAAADNASATLAQRLNDLATANAEGLLSDDEYRMLRQNLFERFASSSTVPSEAPVVPVSIGRHAHQGSESSRNSNFIVDVPTRTPSLRSHQSVSSFFRRSHSKTRTPAGSMDLGDSGSVVSSSSKTSNIFRSLKKKTSNSSITSVQTEASRNPDNISLASRRKFADPPLSSARSVASSHKRYATPPSSFPGPRVPAADLTFSMLDDDDEEKSSADIKQEIAAIEAERKRLMDAFSGLELSTLTKRKTRQASTDGSVYTLTPDTPTTPRRMRGSDSDSMSVRSGTSVSTTHTGRRVVVRQKTSSSLATNSSKLSTPSRKPSNSSMSSSLRGGYGGIVPPIPSLPSGLSSGMNGSSTSLNMMRSTGHLPMSSVPEHDIEQPPPVNVDSEMDEIRRRREEVGQRYEARLEYLQAKLKGALLHEKLMKK